MKHVTGAISYQCPTVPVCNIDKKNTIYYSEEEL